MAQNRSSAVMAQRQMELLAQEHEDFPGQAKLDDYPTQPWGTRALMMMFDRHGLQYRGKVCREPAANRGYMVRPLAEHFEHVIASDVHDYGRGYRIDDFLKPAIPLEPVDWIITNPPFKLGVEFAQRALARCTIGCALLVRTAFTEGVDRYRTIYEHSRPDFNFQFVERLPLVKGRCVRTEINPKTGKEDLVTTATAYCWLVWFKDSPRKVTIQDWIPPCRAELERPDEDYLGEAPR